MARNKPTKPLVETPPEPESSSDEEEEVSGSSTEGEGGEEEEQEQEASSSVASSDEEEEEDEEETPSTPPPPSATPSSAKKVTATTTAKKPTTEDSSDEEPTVAKLKNISSSKPNTTEDSSDDEPPVAKLKAIPSSKPAIEPSPSKPRSKITSSGLAAEKRPAETDDKGTSKKPRREKAGSGPSSASAAVQEEGSKKLFQRVFSADDELEMLKGMIEYRESKGADPMNDVDDFVGFVKKLLHVDVNKVQITDKIRRLKKKFNNAKIKDKKLANEHERRLFELSKKIWDRVEDNSKKEEKISNGVVQNNNPGTKSSSKPRVLKIKNDSKVVASSEDQKKKVEEDVGNGGGKITVDDEMEEDLNVGELVVKEKIRKKAFKKMGVKGRAEINEMWEKVAKAEFEAKMLREEVQKEETRRIMEALGWGKR